MNLVKLPTEDIKKGEVCQLAGWGLTEEDPPQNIPSPVLMWMEELVLSRDQCEALRVIQRENEFCALGVDISTGSAIVCHYVKFLF